METIKATVKNVSVYTTEDTSIVYITIDKDVKGFKRNKENVFEETDTNVISFFRSALTAQLCDKNDDIALFRAMRGQSFTQREFGAILFNATIEITREFKAAGEVVGERAIERDCYITTLTSISLSKKSIAALEKATAL